MLDKTEQGISALTQPLSFFPESLSLAILKHIHQCIHYEPTIGIMGKSGAGKSSLCNTLFHPAPARMDAVKGCTRLAQQYKTSDGLHSLNIIDFPGIGETPTLDMFYSRLYQNWLNRLDLIVWVLRADDRAWSDDIRCYKQLVSLGAEPAQFLFVLSQADKIEPCREWDIVNHHPSPQQAEHLRIKTESATSLFNAVNPVISVSTVESYNLNRWAEALVNALPPISCSAISRHLNSKLRTERIKEHAREGFVRATCEIFDEAATTFHTTSLLVSQFKRLRNSLVSIVRSLWLIVFD